MPDLSDGQFFTVAPPPNPPRSPLPWLLPLGAGAITTLVLVLSFGLGQSQPTNATSPKSEKTADPQSPNLPVAPSPTTELSIAAAPTSDRTTSPAASATPPEPAIADHSNLTIARIHCPGLAVNFRIAPTLQSQVQSIIQDQELIETTGRQVLQDSITWQEIRYRNQFGWIAHTFIRGQ